MSITVNMVVDPCAMCGHRYNFSADPTSNLGPIFTRAFVLSRVRLPRPEMQRGPGLHGLHGFTGGETLPVLREVLRVLSNPEHERMFRDLQAPNGWGTLEDAVDVVSRLCTAAIECPGGTWSVE